MGMCSGCITLGTVTPVTSGVMKLKSLLLLPLGTKWLKWLNGRFTSHLPVQQGIKLLAAFIRIAVNTLYALSATA